MHINIEADTRLNKLQYCLPKTTANSDNPPMRPARNTGGDAPTNQTNNTIRHIVKILEAFLPRKSVILAVRLIKIDMFIPDNATT